MIAQNATYHSTTTTHPAVVKPDETKCDIFTSAPDVSPFPLTDRQRRAAALLVLGHPDKRVCAETGLSRSTLWRWRKSNPAFRAEVARRRQALWHNSADRLRSLVPPALKVLSEHMHSSYDTTSFRAALSVLKLAGAHKLTPPSDPTDPLDVVREDLRRERECGERERERERDGSAGDAPLTPDEIMRKYNELLAECAADDHAQPEYQI